MVASCCAWTVRLPSYFCIPGDSAVSRYGPGKTPGKTYTPASLLNVLRETLVAVFVKVMLACGTTAWCGSVTLPLTVLLLACGQAAGRNTSAPKIKKPIFCMASSSEVAVFTRTDKWLWPVYRLVSFYARPNFAIPS